MTMQTARLPIHMSTLAVSSLLWRSLDKMGYTLENRWQPTPDWQESSQHSTGLLQRG